MKNTRKVLISLMKQTLKCSMLIHDNLEQPGTTWNNLEQSTEPIKSTSKLSFKRVSKINLFSYGNDKENSSMMSQNK